jgi:hypothetical protein
MIKKPVKPPYSIWQEAYRFKDPNLIQPDIVKENGLTLVFRPSTDPRKIRLSYSFRPGKDMVSA